MKSFAFGAALLAVVLLTSSASAQVVCNGGVAVQSFGVQVAPPQVFVPQFAVPQVQTFAVPTVVNQAAFVPFGAVNVNVRHRGNFGGRFGSRLGGRFGSGFSSRTVIRQRF